MGAADSFGTTFLVATVIVACTIIPALFLGRAEKATVLTEFDRIEELALAGADAE